MLQEPTSKEVAGFTKGDGRRSAAATQEVGARSPRAPGGCAHAPGGGMVGFGPRNGPGAGPCAADHGAAHGGSSRNRRSSRCRRVGRRLRPPPYLRRGKRRRDLLQPPGREAPATIDRSDAARGWPATLPLPNRAGEGAGRSCTPWARSPGTRRSPTPGRSEWIGPVAARRTNPGTQGKPPAYDRRAPMRAAARAAEGARRVRRAQLAVTKPAARAWSSDSKYTRRCGATAAAWSLW